MAAESRAQEVGDNRGSTDNVSDARMGTPVRLIEIHANRKSDRKKRKL